MTAIKALFGWFGRKAILYAALVLALLVSPFVLRHLKSEWDEAGRQHDRVARLESVTVQLEAAGEAAEQRLKAAGDAAQRKGVTELDQAIVEAKQAKAEAIGRRRSGPAKALSLARADAKALLEDERLEIEIQYRDREIEGLGLARAQAARQDWLDALPTDLDAQAGRTAAAASSQMASCRSATRALAEFEDRWEVRATFQYWGHEEHEALQVAVRDRCRAATAAYADLARTKALQKQRDDTRRTYSQAQAWTSARIKVVTGEFAAQLAKERAAVDGSLRQKLTVWAERVHLSRVLWQAAGWMALILATPYLIRLFCYFVLAPAAMKRPQIRVGGAAGAPTPIAAAERSTTSVGVRLAPDEELLVRHGYLQTTSEAGAKQTQWLLDWRHPITSVATGLTFLTRIRGAGEVTTVSAVGDPFAEVTVMTLPEGAACVLQPRALAAVAQPTGRPVRVTAHWRLFSLNAWLTLQLRFLVFHGPARLVLKGGRGIRVERAEQGRVLGQDQVVGFSTDLSYSVTRNETFWPYFLGREPLLRDRVAKGEGVLIIEEAPLASRRPGEVRHGIEGMIDAGMKVFGW